MANYTMSGNGFKQLRGVASLRQYGTTDLLSLVGTDLVQRTALSRKITYAGKTTAYPVYRVRLDALYYNDQNDRIATWITRYRSEQGEETLALLEGEEYNRVIENFIYESNPESIQKTQKNIALIGQREPGVALADGRIVDGNRRFTCLRRLQKESAEPLYFETVIMEADIQTNKKQIKLLELAIQHGEEKKVDYDHIDYAIGTYTDVVKTRLLTIEEYANSTNETVTEVRKRIECAEFICELLEHLRIPEQYHVARELQVYSVFQETSSAFHQLREHEKQQLKTILFNNILLHAILDQRKFCRDIKLLIKNKTYEMYFEDQKRLNIEIRKRFDAIAVTGKADLDRFAQDNEDLAEEIQILLERALLRSRKQQLKEKPADHVSKCISLMTEVDPRLFDKMDVMERNGLRKELEALGGIIGNFGAQLGSEIPAPAVSVSEAGHTAPEAPVAPATPVVEDTGRFTIAAANPSKPYVICTSAGKPITRFFVTMRFNAFAIGEDVTEPGEYKVFFAAENGDVVSDIREFSITAGAEITTNIAMRPDSVNLQKCNLVVQSKDCAANEALQLIPFQLKISSSFRK